MTPEENRYQQGKETEAHEPLEERVNPPDGTSEIFANACSRERKLAKSLRLTLYSIVGGVVSSSLGFTTYALAKNPPEERGVPVAALALGTLTAMTLLPSVWLATRAYFLRREVKRGNYWYESDD